MNDGGEPQEEQATLEAPTLKPSAEAHISGPAPATAKGFAENLKTSADALYALVKSILLLLVGAALILVSSVAVWRDLRHRRITVQIDPQAEKLLIDHGIEFDLPSTLVDDVNEKIEGVNDIVQSQGFQNVLGADTPDAVSFKPFGLDISTGDITGLVRNILGIPPEFVVQIGMTCAPAPCRAVPSAAAPRESLMLFVKSQGPTNPQSLSFPLPDSGEGLRRGLREALEQTSETVLQQADPLLASDFFLNQPNGSIFQDNRIRDESLAAAATFDPHPNTPNSNCLAEAIFDGAAFNRGDPQGMLELARMGKRPGLSSTCRMLAETNLALIEDSLARYAPPALRAAYFRAASAALDSLKDIRRRDLSRQEYSRIVAFKIQNDTEQVFSNLMDEDSRAALRGSPFSMSVSIQPIDYTRVVHLVDRIPKRLPPGKDRVQIHGLVDELSTLHQVTAAHSDLPSRYLVSRHLAQMIRLYLPGDPHPRRLFLAEGRAEMDMAWCALRAMALPEDKRQQFVAATTDPADHASPPTLSSLFLQSLNSAAVAFENAAVTLPLAPPLESPSALEPLVMLGDAFYLAGDESQAKNVYADAIHGQFTADGEPPDDLLWLAKAAARWAVILFNEGVCKTSAPRIADWDAAWIPLGAAPDHNLCRLAQPDPPQPAELDKFGVMALAYPLIAESVRQCAIGDPAAASIPTDAARLKTLDCLRSTGPEAYLWAPPQLSAMSRADVDHKIATCLSRSPH